MKQLRDQRGELNILLIPLILISVLFVATAAFAFAINGQKQDYKNNVDNKVAAAVEANTASVQSSDAKKYAEAAKLPLATYTGPSAYGSLRLQYPKTWSGYVDTKSGSNPVDGYFFPGVVPSIDDRDSTFALRVQVVQTAYNQVVQGYNGSLQQKKVTITPYSLPQVPDVIGIQVNGQIEQNKQGTLIVLPIRDKTLKIWTESASFAGDFTTNVLANTTFSP